MSACSADIDVSDAAPLTGRVVIWHNWTGEREAAALQARLTQFNTVYPDITIIERAMPTPRLEREFIAQARLGLGPDIIIGPSLWQMRFVEHELLYELTANNQPDLTPYLPAAINQIRLNNSLYALPLGMQSYVLYYNKDRVDTPPTTLDMMLTQARSGHSIAIPTTFYAAFWGVSAFGGQLFDDTGRVVLNRGGFANWLSWLKEAQTIPTVILNHDDDLLYEMFIAGEADYYVGSSTRLLSLFDALGQETVGVASLPAGPANPSGPFLQAEAMMFNAASSPRQRTLAMALAQFLTNAEQQTELARQSGRIPVNNQVQIDGRFFPTVAALAAQSRTAVPLPLTQQMIDVTTIGDEIYNRALEGLIGVNEAAEELTLRVNTRHGFDALEVATEPTGCGLEGSLEVWHSLRSTTYAVLNATRRDFIRRCPGIVVSLVNFSSPAELQDRYRTDTANGQGPDILIGPNLWLPVLAQSNLIQDITRLVDPSTLQQYRVNALNGTRYQDKFYALPYTIDFNILYHNTFLGGDRIATANDFLGQVSPERPAAFPASFIDSAWALSAFDVWQFVDDNQIIVDEDNFVTWLIWLQSAQQIPGMEVSMDNAALETMFTNREAAYYIGPISKLKQLRTALSPDELHVSTLPTGPQNTPATAFLTVESIMFGPSDTLSQTQLALSFAEYLTQPDRMAFLSEQTGAIPSHITVPPLNEPELGVLLNQSNAEAISILTNNYNSVSTLGDALNSNVLSGQVNPTAAVSAFLEQAFSEDVQMGLVDPSQALACPPASQLTIWYTITGPPADLLLEMVADATTTCPDVQVMAEFVSPSSLVEALLEAGETGPDFMVMPLGAIQPLRDTQILLDIIPNFEPALLELIYLPNIVDAIRTVNDDATQIYGMPYTIEVPALYYNRRVITEPLTTLDGLLAAAAEDGPGVALDNSFWGAYWGVPAFGGQALNLQTGQPRPLENQQGLIDWLKWLSAAQDQPKFYLSASDTRLVERFASGDAAYVIASSRLLPDMEATIGREAVGIALLPPGPMGEARPLMNINIFVFNSLAFESNLELAGRFVQYILDPVYLTRLTTEARLIPPTQLAILREETPNIDGFLGQAERAIPHPLGLNERTLTLGNALYRQVLNQRNSPEEALQKWLDRTQNINEDP